jgi:uncharacterized protein YozE (UPF0346 family)
VARPIKNSQRIKDSFTNSTVNALSSFEKSTKTFNTILDVIDQEATHFLNMATSENSIELKDQKLDESLNDTRIDIINRRADKIKAEINDILSKDTVLTDDDDKKISELYSKLESIIDN